MKKRKNILFSLAFFLIMLLILGQQEIKKAQVLLNDLTRSEVNNFVFTSYDFAEMVKSEASPFVALTQAETIENLLVSKCRFKENVFVQQVDGREIVYNSYGDAGVVQYELERGGKVIVADTKKEIDYFKKEAIPVFRMSSFGLWETLFYFFKKILILLIFTLLPLFFSIKLFILSMSILIIILSLLSVDKSTEGRVAANKITKEFCLKKAPPDIGDKTIVHYDFFVKDCVMPNELVALVNTSVKIVFFGGLVEIIRRALRKIFHVPKYNFVVVERNHLNFNYFNKIILNYGKYQSI